MTPSLEIIETKKYATGLKRFGAAIVDGIIFIPLSVADGIMKKSITDEVLLTLWLIFVILATSLYSVLMHYKYGQTLGKMSANIKVVNADEKRNLSFIQALLRDSFPIFFQLVALVIYYIQAVNEVAAKEELLQGFEGLVGAVVLIWIMLELVSMFTNKKRRAIHDFIAGSVVVRVKGENYYGNERE